VTGYATSSFSGEATGETTIPLSVVTVEEFAAVEEPGADALVGETNDALIPENGDAMLYGDGGAGKTTLGIDLAFHLAAGDGWLGMPVKRPVRVLLIENEGPRPLFRVKLRHKRDGWHGSALGDRLLVLERPWARFTFAEKDKRIVLAQVIAAREVDVVIVGPLARSGMNEAGTLQEVRDFMALVADARARAERRVAVVLIHHENKGGKVSGAWEGSGDTLLHVQGQGHGRTRLYIQKARWSSALHGTSLQLVWIDGDGFTRADEEQPRPERTWTDIAEFVLANGGCNWVEVERSVSGQGDYLRKRRDWMLADGVIINAGSGKRFELWHRDDPARAALDVTVSPEGHGSDSAVSGTGDEGDNRDRVPVSDNREDTGYGDTVSASPDALQRDAGLRGA
jgi:hypothetical protein